MTIGPGDPPPPVDVLVPTCNRPAALAVTLTAVLSQTLRPARVVVSDQGDTDAFADPVVTAVLRVLAVNGVAVECHRHLPRRGLAEQRQFLLDSARSPLVLYLDDDVICEPDLLDRMVRALRRAGCGFVGSFPNAPGALASTDPADTPPPDLAIDLWDGPVVAEQVRPGDAAWNRSWVHFAAHLHHLGRRLGPEPGGDRLYRVAWVGGCVLFDSAKLRAAGGFGFWPDLPPRHCGEDVVAQLRVMARFGGAGLTPSGAWHQEVPTTVPDRRLDAPHLLEPGPRHGAGIRPASQPASQPDSEPNSQPESKEDTRVHLETAVAARPPAHPGGTARQRR